jgi:2-C-methyl-D-erythritol 4-phosphate cytidylyltransferase
MENAALVPAAGLGARFAASDNNPAKARGASPKACERDNFAKQFRHLLGFPLYIWSIQKLCQNEEIESVGLVLSQEAMGMVADELSRYLTTAEIKKIELTVGGASRQESVFKGLLNLAARNPRIVLVHDAVRPFLTSEMIDSSIQAAAETGACTMAQPVTDTVKRVHGGAIQETIDRSELYLIQTPQAARFDWLLDAHKAAKENGLSTTDDAAILEASGHKVSIVQGQPYNVKLTTAADLRLCEAIATWFQAHDLAPKVL